MEENDQIKDVRRQYQKYVMTIKEGFSEIDSKRSLKWFISYSIIMSFRIKDAISGSVTPDSAFTSGRKVTR